MLKNAHFILVKAPKCINVSIISRYRGHDHRNRRYLLSNKSFVGFVHRAGVDFMFFINEFKQLPLLRSYIDRVFDVNV